MQRLKPGTAVSPLNCQQCQRKGLADITFVKLTFGVNDVLAGLGERLCEPRARDVPQISGFCLKPDAAHNSSSDPNVTFVQQHLLSFDPTWTATAETSAVQQQAGLPLSLQQDSGCSHDATLATVAPQLPNLPVIGTNTRPDPNAAPALEAYAGLSCSGSWTLSGPASQLQSMCRLLGQQLT
jgi:hypothetical protein